MARLHGEHYWFRQRDCGNSHRPQGLVVSVATTDAFHSKYSVRLMHRMRRTSPPTCLFKTPRVQHDLMPVSHTAHVIRNFLRGSASKHIKVISSGDGRRTCSKRKREFPHMHTRKHNHMYPACHQQMHSRAPDTTNPTARRHISLPRRRPTGVSSLWKLFPGQS